jgi:hypothetical protein
MVHRGTPQFTKPTRFQIGFQLVSTCTALPRRGKPRPPLRGLQSSTFQLNVSTYWGLQWVRLVDRWVTTRHKLDTKLLTDQNGLG